MQLSLKGSAEVAIYKEKVEECRALIFDNVLYTNPLIENAVTHAEEVIGKAVNALEARK